MPEGEFRHNHSADFWTADKRGDKKQKNRLRILLTAIGIALLLLVICIFVAIGEAQVTGYIPTLILELDRSPIGKSPLVLTTIQLPQISGDYPKKLEFPAPDIQQDLNFDQPFSPVINRRVEYQPVYELSDSCPFCSLIP